MSDVILFKREKRLPFQYIKKTEANNKLIAVLGACSQIMGYRMEKSDLVFCAENLETVLRRDFKQYDMTEIEQILKFGFAQYGSDVKNVSVSSCVELLRKWESNPKNKENLQKIIDEQTRYKRGETTDEEKKAMEEKNMFVSFVNALQKYEQGMVTENDKYFSFPLCYKLVKNYIRDDSIMIAAETAKKIFENVNELYVQKLSSDSAKNTIFDDLLKLIPRKIVTTAMFHSVLFHIWAQKNYKNYLYVLD